MNPRRLLVALTAIAVLASCRESFSSPETPGGSGPRLLRWGTSGAPSFGFEGAHEVGSRRARILNPVPPAIGAASHTAGDAQALTWTHDAGSGGNRLIVVTVSAQGGSKPVQSVTFQGLPLTLLGTRNNPDNSVRVEFWYRVAPPAGTGPVVVTRSDKEKTIAGAVTLTGVHQTAPFGVLATAASTGSSTASVAVTGAVGDVILDAVVSKGGQVTAFGAGQSPRWNSGYDNDYDGTVSTRAGAASATMAATLSGSAKWAMAAVAVKPAPLLGLTQYQATFWAVRGQSRSLQINYSAAGGNAPFLRLTTSDPTWIPGQGPLAAGDSVLVTATVDPIALAVTFQPHGLLFGAPASLEVWYGGANGDFNADGLVDGTDSYIESNLLGIWYQAETGEAWEPVAASRSVATKSFTALLEHFSGYSVAW